MPNYYDFNKLDNIKEIRVCPEGWVDSLIVEYGIDYYKENLSYYWRVKGTQHTFIIPVIRMDYLTEGEYVIHFEEVLEVFREDYKKWASEGWNTEWMQAYRRDFSKFITL